MGGMVLGLPGVLHQKDLCSEYALGPSIMSKAVSTGLCGSAG
jgi:hypothetical protein